MAEHANSFLLVTILVLLAIVLVFGMKYFSAGRQAQSRAVREDAYRALAESAASLQGTVAASLAALQADFAETKTRLAVIERMLREVE
jgi:Tfp pilus assembly protein PilO